MFAVRVLEQFRICSNLLEGGSCSLVALNLAKIARDDRQFADAVVSKLEQRYPDSDVAELYRTLVGA